MSTKIWARAALVLAAMILASTLIKNATGNELIDGSRTSGGTVTLADKIDHALYWLVQGHRWHPLHRSERYRQEWASAISTASTEHGVPPLLLTTMGWFEGSYQKKVLSGERLGTARSEFGMWQQHGIALLESKRKGFNLKTKLGQARAGASWLRHGIDFCGSIEAGLTVYACGRCRAKSNTRPAKQVASRLKMWQKLESLTQGKNNEQGRIARIAKAEYQP